MTENTDEEEFDEDQSELAKEFKACLLYTSKSGWLLTNPNITYIFWGSYWQNTGESLYYHNIWTNLYSTDIVFDRLAEYGISNPILNANYYKVNTDFLNDSTSDVQSSFDDGKIVTEINKDIQEGTIPTPETDTLYVISVSYTHLDVYKRQVSGPRRFLSCFRLGP